MLQGFENTECPRCKSCQSIIIATGKDYLYGVDGCFSAVECDVCKLWYLNPKPKTDFIKYVYPSAYSPHAKATNGSALQSTINKVSTKNLFQKIINALSWRIKYIIFNKEKYNTSVLGYPIHQKLIPCPFYFCGGWLTGVELIPHFVKNGSLLDIGCANGDRLSKLRDLGWQRITGIELVESAAELARSRGFEVKCGRIEDSLNEISDYSLDVVIMSMVLEHLENPFEIVQKIARKLKPGGEFLFSTVVRDSIDYKIFKSYWAGFDFPRHMIFFKRQDLQGMLKKQFKEIRFSYQNAPIDFIRSASWRKNGYLDQLIIWVAGSRLFIFIGYFMAFAGWTSRVSIRCKTKQILNNE